MELAQQLEALGDLYTLSEWVNAKGIIPHEQNDKQNRTCNTIPCVFQRKMMYFSREHVNKKSHMKYINMVANSGVGVRGGMRINGSKEVWSLIT